MREITATEAARQFSAVLTAVEKDDETFVVTRGGRVVARIEPAGGTSGAAVKALLRHFRPDPTWQTDLAQIRAGVTEQDRTWRD